ncbi:MAG: hypothetical protein WC080_02070 [Patescibacteria group bacterium]|jgi:hypothetical protein
MNPAAITQEVKMSELAEKEREAAEEGQVCGECGERHPGYTCQEYRDACDTAESRI